MVPFIGLLVWILALTALARVMRATLSARAACARDAVFWGLLGLLALGLLGRPNEEILGGQDPGAYLNAAASFARDKTLFHVDPLLAQVPPDARPGFFYGHSAFGLTKDACLWVHDAARALIGPWFQPAYPILMSPVAVVSPGAILWVAPLLGWMTGLVVACLAARLIARPWAATLAFAFYVLSPVTVWNARCPRAELGASFFLLAGWALLLQAWRCRRWQGWRDLLLGALCLGVAPFFHATAWQPVLATFAILALAAAAGRVDFLPALPFVLVSIIGFVAQAALITDCYYIWLRYRDLMLANRGLLGFLAGAGLAGVTALSLWNRRRAGGAPPPARSWPWVDRSLRLALTILPPLAFLAVYALRNDSGQVFFLSPQTARYLTLTDFHGVVRLTSPLVAAAAVAGWMVLAWKRNAADPSRAGLAFMAALFPGIVLTGWMDDYMMETRRLLVVPAPMMALCVAALVTSVAAFRRRWSGAAAAAACVVLLGSMIWHKTPLYAQTEYRGLHRFLARFAGDIRRDHGLLLAEYSPVAAPFEHFFGIPTLSIDSDRWRDYRQQELAWLKVMQAHPGQRAFFLSPYADPVSDLFDFTLVRQGIFAGVRMPGARRAIPDEARPTQLPLHLYGMSVKQAAPETTGAFVRRFDGGNMGLRRFATLVTKPQQARGCALAANVDTRVSWTPRVTNTPSKDLHVLFQAGTTNGQPPRVVFANGSAPVEWTPLVDGWWSVRVRAIPANASSLDLRAQDSGLLLAQVAERAGDVCLPVHLESPAPTNTVPLAAFTARWARDQAELLLPAPSGPAVDLFVLMRLVSDQPAGALAVAVNGGPALPAELTPGVWEWRVMPLERGLRSNNVARLAFHSTPPWNPGLRGFPDDLAVLVGSAVMRQAANPPDSVGAPRESPPRRP